ncbi:MAG: SDR family oxidoreductase [Negativicutes bacterium]|nr:SDR family oxidoreductase [Negativicutes bacterium]
MNNLFSVEGRVIIVTGCAQGIGFNYARGLANHGARLAICDRQEDKLQMAENTLAAIGNEVMAAPVDVTVPEQVQNFVTKTMERYGHIDALVNNAGVLLRRLPEEMTAEEWDFIQDVNVKGTFLFSQAAGREMIKRKHGAIVNIASIGSRQALSLRLGYCTSKAAVEQFTRTLAYEWGRYNIRVNAIAPGYIKSDMNADLRANPEIYNKMVSEVPLGRFGEADDLLGTLIYLCSPASAYVSGQTVYVDGGKTTQ